MWPAHPSFRRRTPGTAKGRSWKRRRVSRWPNRFPIRRVPRLSRTNAPRTRRSCTSCPARMRSRRARDHHLGAIVAARQVPARFGRAAGSCRSPKPRPGAKSSVSAHSMGVRRERREQAWRATRAPLQAAVRSMASASLVPGSADWQASRRLLGARLRDLRGPFSAGIHGVPGVPGAGCMTGQDR